MGASKANIDFTNVKEGGQFSKKRMPIGDYLARVVKVEDAQPKRSDDNSKMWLFTIKLEKTPSATYPYYCKLVENQLWKIRNLLVASGLNVPKKRVAVDPNRIVGRLIGVSLADTEYEGREQSEIESVFPATDLSPDIDVTDDEEDDEDIDETPKRTKRPTPVIDDEDDEEGDEDEAPRKTKKPKATSVAEDEDDDEPAPKKRKRSTVEDDDLDELDVEDL